MEFATKNHAEAIFVGVGIASNNLVQTAKARSQLSWQLQYVHYFGQALDWSRPYLTQTRPAILTVPSVVKGERVAIDRLLLTRL